MAIPYNPYAPLLTPGVPGAFGQPIPPAFPQYQTSMNQSQGGQQQYQTPMNQSQGPAQQQYMTPMNQSMQGNAAPQISTNQGSVQGYVQQSQLQPQISTPGGVHPGYVQPGGQPMQSNMNMQSTNQGPKPGQVTAGNNVVKPTATPAEVVPEVTTTTVKGPEGTTTTKTEKTMPPAPIEPQQPQPDMSVYDSETMLSNMVQGNNQFMVGNPEAYKKAQNRMNAMTLMGQQDPGTLAGMIESGRFSRADNLITDLMKYNPQFYAQVQSQVRNQKTLAHLNDLQHNIMKNMSGYDLSKGQMAYKGEDVAPQSGLDDVNNGIMDALNQKFGSNAEKYVAITQQLMNNPEIQSQKQKVAAADKDIAKIDDDIREVELNTRKLFGSETPEAVVSAYIARQTKDLTNSKSRLITDANYERDVLKSMTDQATETLDAYKAGNALDVQAAQQAQEQANFERTFSAQEAQRQFNNQLDLVKLNQTSAPEWKKDADSGVYYRTGSDGQLEFTTAPQQPSFTPTGQYSTINIPTAHAGGINIQVDNVASSSLQAAFQQMAAAGLKPQVNQSEGGFRSYEQQKKLYDAYIAGTGPQAAPPGKSNHEKGLSVDITNVTPEMAKFMNDNGRKQTAGPNDKGHFDYVGINKPTETKAQLAEITSLRKEFDGLPEVKTFKTVRQMYDSVNAASKLDTAAGDLSLVFAYMKILDPNSVVRETEFANAENAKGVPDKIRNVYNKVMKGTRLTANQRKDFQGTAQKVYKTYEDIYNQTFQRYQTYAQLGGDTSRIGVGYGQQNYAPGDPLGIF